MTGVLLFLTLALTNLIEWRIGRAGWPAAVPLLALGVLFLLDAIPAVPALESTAAMLIVFALWFVTSIWLLARPRRVEARG